MLKDGNINPKSKNFPGRSQQRTPETPKQMSWIAMGMASPRATKQQER
jgi:hypothetical protein